MRKLIAALIALGPAWATPLAAQDFCQSIYAVTNEAPNDFINFQGEALDEKAFDSTLLLPGARSCEVDRDDGAVFRCRWGAASPQEAVNSAIGFANSIYACFQGAGKREHNSEFGPIFDTFTNGLRIRVWAKTERNIVLLDVSRDSAGDAQRYAVPSQQAEPVNPPVDTGAPPVIVDQSQEPQNEVIMVDPAQ